MDLAIITDLMKPYFRKIFIDSLQNSQNPFAGTPQKKAVILDVRTEKEYETGHIEGSVN